MTLVKEAQEETSSGCTGKSKVSREKISWIKQQQTNKQMKRMYLIVWCIAESWDTSMTAQIKKDTTVSNSGTF
jgi:hypothetical protein